MSVGFGNPDFIYEGGLDGLSPAEQRDALYMLRESGEHASVILRRLGLNWRKVRAIFVAAKQPAHQRYVWRDGHFRHAKTGSPMRIAKRAKLRVPMVTPVMADYASPIDGRVIATRHDRREDLKRNNCVEAGDFVSPTGGKIRNKAFAAKRGLTVSEEFR